MACQTEKPKTDPLTTLLKMSKDSTLSIEVGSRKLQLKHQGGEVVVRTGGGFLRWDEFLQRYGASVARAAGGVVDGGASGSGGPTNIAGTVVRGRRGIPLLR
jgi:hypothetical protein